MIYLSVSALKDYLSCPKRYWWRIKRRATPVINKYVFRGQVVHNAIEKHNNIEDAIAFADLQYDMDFLYEGDTPKEVISMLTNYYTRIEDKLEPRIPENIEMNFKVRWDERAYIVGKIDRISSARDKVYDWKTTYKKPAISDLQDPQFYMYNWAVKQKFNVDSTVFYGHLTSGSLFRVDISKKMWYNIEYLINQVLDELEDKSYYPRVPGYQCGSCFFNSLCWSEFKHELDN